MPQAISRPTQPTSLIAFKRLQSGARPLLIGLRELLAMTCLISSLAVGLVVLADSLGRLA